MSEGVLLCGKRGTGKTLVAMSRIQQKMQSGCQIATNINLDITKLVSARNQCRPYRLPDWPMAPDLDALPLGNSGLYYCETGEIKMKIGFDESKNGLLVLDELATFLNSRNWQAAQRQELINWLLQSRKFGWDLLFLAQHPRLVDAQVRDSLFDLCGNVRRLDKISVPIIGRIASLMGFELKMPRIHVATLKYGINHDSPVVQHIWCRGNDLFHAYDTTQKIDPAVGVKNGEGYQYLSHYDRVGKNLGWWEMNRKLCLLLVIFGASMGVAIDRYTPILFPPATHVAVQNEKSIYSDQKINGLMGRPGQQLALLADGKILPVDVLRQTASGLEIKSGSVWYRGDLR